MPVKHRLELAFRPSHVQEPLVCEMTRRFKNVMFNVDAISVGIQSATMRLSIMGKASEVKKAKDYIKSLNVTMKTRSACRCNEKIPDVSRKGLHTEASPDDVVQRKLWLTFLGKQQRLPFLWMLARQFDVTYKITQSTSGDEVAILSLLVYGPQAEVEGVVAFLREQEINVEFGELSLSTPFGPEF
jgi:ABC-type methionine transport system ATPase subunit